VPETEFTFQVTFANSGFSGMVTKPWSQRERNVFQILPEIQGKLQRIPGIQIFPVTPPALPGGGQFPVEFVIASTADSREILAIAEQVQLKAITSGMFAFPPMIDVKFDQPQSEVVVDRDKVAALGLNLQQVSADLGAAIGGNYVNRFNIAGRSYKVIPQVERVDRLNPDQLENLYVTGPNGQLVPLSAVATLRQSTQARSLNRFQQLNAVKISGVAIRPLDQALRFLEDEAAKLMPQGYVIDYTGESRQLRLEGGNRFFATMGLAIVLIFPGAGGAVQQLPRSVHHPARLGAAGDVRRADLQLFEDAEPEPAFLDGRLDDDAEHLFQSRLVTLIGLMSKNGILIVEFANKLQREAGLAKLAAVHEAALIRLRPILMTSAATIAGHFPLVLVTGAGAAARNSIGLVLVGGMAVGTLFTLFVSSGGHGTGNGVCSSVSGWIITESGFLLPVIPAQAGVTNSEI
jgi:multidrug efflux pump